MGTNQKIRNATDQKASSCKQMTIRQTKRNVIEIWSWCLKQRSDLIWLPALSSRQTDNVRDSPQIRKQAFCAPRLRCRSPRRRKCEAVINDQINTSYLLSVRQTSMLTNAATHQNFKAAPLERSRAHKQVFPVKILISVIFERSGCLMLMVCFQCLDSRFRQGSPVVVVVSRSCFSCIYTLYLYGIWALMD